MTELETTFLVGGLTGFMLGALCGVVLMVLLDLKWRRRHD